VHFTAPPVPRKCTLTCAPALLQVIDAQLKQLQQINTNSRYLSEVHSRFVAALAARFPDPLKTAYLVNSGSEANDLALQISLAARPGASCIAVMDGAYHGHVSTMMDVSPYKFWGPRGSGRASHVLVLPLPDKYRCNLNLPQCRSMNPKQSRGGDPCLLAIPCTAVSVPLPYQCRQRHVSGRQAARTAIRQAEVQGQKIAAFFCESVLSCAGQVLLPEGFLQEVVDEMHAHGAGACAPNTCQHESRNLQSSSSEAFCWWTAH
jgi:4-aminobutyrate aminotransferase-like enzyme